MLVRGVTRGFIGLVCIGLGLLAALSVRHWRIPTISQAMASSANEVATATPMMAVARGTVSARAASGVSSPDAGRRSTITAGGPGWYASLSSHSPPLPLIVTEGMTRIGDSLVAVRRGEVVSVHFDTPGLRTRRADKFEQIVRATLPAVYGPLADSLLARYPIAPLVLRAGGLLPDLPARGLRLPLGMGWVLALWPETRPGQDGPLVVTYRATVMRGTPD
jgi:hypothetical protein